MYLCVCVCVLMKGMCLVELDSLFSWILYLLHTHRHTHTQTVRASCLFSSNLSNSILLCPVCTHPPTHTHINAHSQTHWLSATKSCWGHFSVTMDSIAISLCFSLILPSLQRRAEDAFVSHVGGNESHSHTHIDYLWCCEWLSHSQNTDEVRGEEMGWRDE